MKTHKQFSFLKKCILALSSVSLGFFLSVFIVSEGLPVEPFIPLAHADEDEQEKAEFEIAPTCPSEYYSFIVSARDEETKTAYFKDFFTLSYCQISDIQKVYDQLGAVRDNFRSAAFACEDTGEYKAQYYELLMEVYFIRNIQNMSAGVFQDEDQEWVEVYSEVILDNLQEDMEEIFVDKYGHVTEDKLDTYFKQWRDEYGDRVFNYALCDEGPWAELNDSVESFAETMVYITSFKERMAEIEVSKGNSFTNLKNNGDFEFEANDQAKAVGQGLINTWNYLTKLKEQKIDENVPEPKSLEEAIADGDVTTISEALSLVEDQENIFDIGVNAETRMAKYELLYGNTGSVAASELQGAVGLINISLGESIKVLKDGSKSKDADGPPLIQLAEDIYGKQCQ